MQALILNSGVGRRLLPHTKDKPKAFVQLSYGETIIQRQLRFLERLRIKDVVITTGPFHDSFEALKKDFPKLNIRLVHNPKYDSSNSVYSFYLAKDFINEDTIVMHGDVVFSYSSLKSIYESNGDRVLVESNIPKDYKDFLAIINKGFIREINTKFQTTYNDLIAVKPLYKFSKKIMKEWFQESKKLIETTGLNAYAEFALNTLTFESRILPFEVSNSFAEEVDDSNDLTHVSNEIIHYDYLDQEIIYSNSYYDEIERFLKDYQLTRPFLVHGKHFVKEQQFQGLMSSSNWIFFDEFTPNPNVEEVLVGLELFKKSSCDSFVVLGGGSAIDIAKAIKYAVEESNLTSSNLNSFNRCPIIAIPSTAGTGSESTKYSVIYNKDVKLSLSHHSLFPDRVILSADLLFNVPKYVKHSSLMDALTQAIESIWSRQSNHISKAYAVESLRLLEQHMDKYIQGKTEVYEYIMSASNLSGRAINLTATTAPHALSYLLTKKYGISHGHAVAICMPGVIRQLISYTSMDFDGEIKQNIDLICSALKLNSLEELNKWIIELIERLNLDSKIVDSNDIDYLVQGVNFERLNNHPIPLTSKNIREIYRNIVLK